MPCSTSYAGGDGRGKWFSANQVFSKLTVSMPVREIHSAFLTLMFNCIFVQVYCNTWIKLKGCDGFYFVYYLDYS